MNSDVCASDPCVIFYDGDYPSKTFSKYPENFDETTKYQGLHGDVDRYLELFKVHGGPVLELCCGTGRVGIPLAKAGAEITCVDIAESMLSRFAKNIERIDGNLNKQIELVHQDVTKLKLGHQNYRLALIPFNSLLCIPSFTGQMAALSAIANHLAPDSRLVLDIVNPLRLKIDGDPIPKPFFTRKNPNNGNTYTRFAMCDAFDSDHKQRLHGWYDEIDQNGHLMRSHYSMHWRPIFRSEIVLMLEKAGLTIETIEGGHSKEAYTAQSSRMLIIAMKPAGR